MSREFDGIGLYHLVPTTLMIGEVFGFHGIIEENISSNPFPMIYVSFSEIGGNGAKFTCSELLERGQT